MRTVSFLLLMPLALAGVVAVIQVGRPVAEPNRGDRGAALAMRQVGKNVPVVGHGPLLRVLRVVHRGRVVEGREPFTGKPVPMRTSDRAASAHSRYVIQRYGYAATARRTICLTFDDGPDPVYTPMLLDVLSKNHVPATFFVIGERAAAYPDIVQREVREGHSVANHSLTHPPISKVQGWRAHYELVLTDRVLRTVSHVATRLFRLPYGGQDGQSIRRYLDGILRAQRLGYVVAAYE